MHGPIKFLNRYIWPRDGNLTGTMALSQWKPRSYSNEDVLHTSLIFWTGTSLLDTV